MCLALQSNYHYISAVGTELQGNSVIKHRSSVCELHIVWILLVAMLVARYFRKQIHLCVSSANDGISEKKRPTISWHILGKHLYNAENEFIVRYPGNTIRNKSCPYTPPHSLRAHEIRWTETPYYTALRVIVTFHISPQTVMKFQWRFMVGCLYRLWNSSLRNILKADTASEAVY